MPQKTSAPSPLIARTPTEVRASGNLLLRCPHCLVQGSFSQIPAGAFRYFSDNGEGGYSANTERNVAIRKCPNEECGAFVFTITLKGVLEHSWPSELIDFSVEGIDSDTIKSLLGEAIACHGAGAYRAAAIIVRRLLEQICHENDAQGKNLHQRLESLHDKVALPNALFEAMGELKLLGNDAAHVEAKSYDDVGIEEAAVAIELSKEILKSLYQLQGLVDRLRNHKK